MAEATAKIESVTLTLNRDEAEFVRDAVGREGSETAMHLYQVLGELVGYNDDPEPDGLGFYGPDRRAFSLHVSLRNGWVVEDSLPWRIRNVLKGEIAQRAGLTRDDVDVKVTFGAAAVTLGRGETEA